MPRTQRLNILEALNFVLAGHTVKAYSRDAKVLAISLKDGEIRLEMNATLDHPKKTTRLLHGRDLPMLADIEWHAGDDRSIKGYF